MILTSEPQIFLIENEFLTHQVNIFFISRMAEVTLIQEGYAREINSVFHARCTVCLISLRNAVNETFEFEKQKPEISPVQNVLFDCGASHERDTITESKVQKKDS